MDGIELNVLGWIGLDCVDRVSLGLIDCNALGFGLLLDEIDTFKFDFLKNVPYRVRGSIMFCFEKKHVF